MFLIYFVRVEASISTYYQYNLIHYDGFTTVTTIIGGVSCIIVSLPKYNQPLYDRPTVRQLVAPPCEQLSLLCVYAVIPHNKPHQTPLSTYTYTIHYSLHIGRHVANHRLRTY